MKTVMRVFAAVLLLGFAFACSSKENETAAATGAGGAGGAGAAQGAEASVGVGGGYSDRQVKVVVPESYDGTQKVPLVVLLHGYSASGLVQDAYFKLTAQAEARGFIYAIPEGTVDKLGNKFWNATEACCNFNQSDVDDSGFLSSLVDELTASYEIDPKRVFFIGHSNGGFMSYRMACDHADKVAAIVSLAGGMLTDPADCTASEPVSVLQVHGTDDATIAYEGGEIGGATFPGAAESVLEWVKRDGCAEAPIDGGLLDIESMLDGEETKVTRYEGCEAGSEVELWTIDQGKHIPQLSPEFAPKVIEFLLTHPKP